MSKDWYILYFINQHSDHRASVFAFIDKKINNGLMWINGFVSDSVILIGDGDCSLNSIDVLSLVCNNCFWIILDMDSGHA